MYKFTLVPAFKRGALFQDSDKMRMLMTIHRYLPHENAVADDSYITTAHVLPYSRHPAVVLHADYYAQHCAENGRFEGVIFHIFHAYYSCIISKNSCLYLLDFLCNCYFLLPFFEHLFFSVSRTQEFCSLFFYDR